MLVAVGASALIYRAKHQPQPIAPPTPVSAKPPIATPLQADTFPILFESIPSGADVYEGVSKLGTTPLQMTLDNGPLAAAPRSFRIVKEGYQPYSTVQGPSHIAVKILATLGEIPKPAEPAAAEPVKKQTKHRETTPDDQPELRLRR